VKPIYFHPNERQNKPVVVKHKLSDTGWEACLTLGYAPADEEYEELGLEPPKKYDPYYVSLSKQGLDLIKNDRVIRFHQLSEIDLVDYRHNRYNLVRGELDLKKGFTSAITKNSIISDAHFLQLMSQVREFLDAGGYLKKKTYPDVLPELAEEVGRRDGFLERFLFAYPAVSPAKWSEEVVPEELRAKVQHVFERLRRSEDDVRITLSAEAKERWIRWHDENTELIQAVEGITAGMYAKLPSQCARLALILHCLEHPEHSHKLALPECTMEAAIALVEYHRAHNEYVLSRISAAPAPAQHLRRERILQALEEKGELTRTEIDEVLNKCVPKAQWEQIMADLVSEGVVEHSKGSSGPRGGRPAEIWRLIQEERENHPAPPSEEFEG